MGWEKLIEMKKIIQYRINSIQLFAHLRGTGIFNAENEYKQNGLININNERFKGFESFGQIPNNNDNQHANQTIDRSI